MENISEMSEISHMKRYHRIISYFGIYENKDSGLIISRDCVDENHKVHSMVVSIPQRIGIALQVA